MPLRPRLPARIGVVSAAAVACALVFASAPAVAEVPTYILNEPAIARVTPSLFYLEVTYQGYLRDTTTGRLRSDDPVVFQRRCSGVVVDTAGDGLTTTLCVQPSDDIVLGSALYQFGHDLVVAHKVNSGELDSFVAGIRDTTVFTGAQPGSRPAVDMFAQFDIAVPGRHEPPAVPVTVSATQPATAGDAALVRLKGSDFPAVEFGGGDDPQPGESLVIVGYGEGISAEVAGDYTIRAATVTVTGRTGTNRFGVSADLGEASRGGAVVDESGRLVALIDTDGSVDNQPNHDLLLRQHIDELMAKAGVTNQRSDADREYDSALDAYFAGRYSTAIGRFDALLAAGPSWSAVQTYRDRAQQRLADEGNAVPNEATWGEYAVTLLLGALIVTVLGAAGRVVSRRSARRAAWSPSGAPLSVLIDGLAQRSASRRSAVTRFVGRAAIPSPVRGAGPTVPPPTPWS